MEEQMAMTAKDMRTMLGREEPPTPTLPSAKAQKFTEQMTNELLGKTEELKEKVTPKG